MVRESILHSVSLDEIVDVAPGGLSQVHPGAGHKVGERAASWDVRAPPDVKPPTQNLEHKGTPHSELFLSVSLKFILMYIGALTYA